MPSPVVIVFLLFSLPLYSKQSSFSFFLHTIIYVSMFLSSRISIKMSNYFCLFLLQKNVNCLTIVKWTHSRNWYMSYIDIYCFYCWYLFAHVSRKKMMKWLILGRNGWMESADNFSLNIVDGLEFSTWYRKFMYIIR